jgi:hypothetical protein
MSRREPLAEGHVMSDTAMVARKPAGGDPLARRPLIDEELADQLLGKAQEQPQRDEQDATHLNALYLRTRHRCRQAMTNRVVLPCCSRPGSDARPSLQTQRWRR